MNENLHLALTIFGAIGIFIYLVVILPMLLNGSTLVLVLSILVTALIAGYVLRRIILTIYQHSKDKKENV